MSNTGLPADLRAAMQVLAEDPDPAPEPFERVARWRRACGDAETAATWQTWSLLPPDPAELREALAALWRGVGELQQATALLQAAQATPSMQPSWEALALALEQEQLDDAIQLQTRLLETRPNLSVPKLLDLLRLWQQHGQAPQALALLEPLMQWMEQRGEPPSGQLCNIRADLLERLERFDDAEPWWQRSHALQPQQVWPLMRLGHQAMRKGQPAVAVHYSRQVLSRDPSHLYAPRLQRRALEALGATRSLGLLDGITQADTITPLAEPPSQEFWRGCRRIALIGFSDAGLLQHWCTALQEPPQDGPSQPPAELWLIASPEPLWLEHQAQQLFKRLERPQPVAISSWPVWEPQRHGHCDRVIHHQDAPPFWRQQEMEP